MNRLLVYCILLYKEVLLMANKKVGTIYGDTIQNSPVCGGGHHQVFTNSKGSKFTIEGDIIDNIVGPEKEQVIYQNGKK